MTGLARQIPSRRQNLSDPSATLQASLEKGAPVWDLWDSQVDDQHAAQNAREHRTMAELLLTRGQRIAAAIVAASTYSSDFVDNWDGGQYEVVLGVPAVAFDQVGDSMREVLSAAARDITGHGHFRGLIVQVRLQDPEPDWQRILLEDVFGNDRSAPTRQPALALGNTDAPG